MSGQEPTQRIPRDVLCRLRELSRPRAPAVIRREPMPPSPDDFDDEEAPSVLVALEHDATPRFERLPPSPPSILSEILAVASLSRVAFRSR